MGIDHIPELVNISQCNIEKGNADLLKEGRIELTVGDGRLGVPEHGPYNAIHVGAAASSVPDALIQQLKVLLSYNYINLFKIRNYFIVLDWWTTYSPSGTSRR